MARIIRGWPQAEIVLTGPSRLGKTPLAIYLSVLGWRVANVPLVPGVPPRPELFALDRRRVIGLTIEEGELLMFRQHRQSGRSSRRSVGSTPTFGTGSGQAPELLYQRVAQRAALFCYIMGGCAVWDEGRLRVADAGTAEGQAQAYRANLRRAGHVRGDFVNWLDSGDQLPAPASPKGSRFRTPTTASAARSMTSMPDMPALTAQRNYVLSDAYVEQWGARRR
ncbi:MAG: kinase/pyrophosphorylase [Chloroflexi bacterium]|nr:kinase/pyrophosphorylase [Chloroflexota bacterium]